MIPKPPTWMRSKITACPNPDQYVPVSTVARPVTQTAEVAVNSASSNGALSPVALDQGNISRPVPTAIAPAKP